jgi:GNAT superfamily N-acetyltransferase
MTIQIYDVLPDDPGPAFSLDGGVTPIDASDRRLHAPNRHLLAVDNGSLVARCSCWWRDTAPIGGQPLGAIGHYAAADPGSAVALLTRACQVLSDAGCTTAVGPMDGNTWRRYRFVVDRGPEPPFFLEPDNRDDWPEHWFASGFSVLAHYTSALNEDLTHEDPRTAAVLPTLAEAGISIRCFDPGRADAELRRIYALSLLAFRRNFLYSPIAEGEFLAQNRAILPFVRPELILLAERGDELVGFMFAVPDVLQARRGTAPDTVILKTIAVAPAATGIGLGGVLMDRVQRAARALGFRRAIHALMHEDNISQRISKHYGRTIRRYALFARLLPD